MSTNRTALIVTVTVLVLGIGGWFFTREKNSQEVTYRTATVEMTDIQQTVSATGAVQPLTTVDIKSRAGGEIKVLAVEVGDVIKPGTLIARIDPNDSETVYNQAQADVSSAEARVSQARQTMTLQQQTSALNIADAEAQVASAESRLLQATSQSNAQPELTEAAVRQAKASLQTAQQQVAQIQQASDPQARADAKSSLDTAEANLQNAEQNLKRQEQLLGKGFVSQQAVDAARTQRDVVMAQRNAAQTRFETVGKGQEVSLAAAQSRVLEAKASLKTAEIQRMQVGLRKQDVATARAALASAKANLATAKANMAQIGIRAADIETAKAQIARSEAQMKNAQVQLNSTTIRAPRAGVILTKYVEEGTIITSGQSFNSQGTSLVQIGDLSRIFVDALVDEADIAQVKVGQKVKVTLDAFPDEVWEARVRRIDPRGTTDQNVTSIKTQVEINKPDPRLRPGLNAECEFIIAAKSGVLTVPTRAIKSEKDKKTVQVLIPDANAKKDDKAGETGKVEVREIVTGLEAGDATEVISGLKEGDKVVVQTIKPGDDKNKGPQGGGPGGQGSGRPGGFGGFGR